MRTPSLALVLLGAASLGAASACGVDIDASAPRVVKLAAFLHADASLAAWMFDGSDPEPGVASSGIPGAARAASFGDFIQATYPACAELSGVGETRTVVFQRCPGPFGIGELHGVIHFTFTSRSNPQGTELEDGMITESESEIELWGHRIAVRSFTDSGSSSTPYVIGYVTDASGTAAGSMPVALTGDTEHAVDPELCLVGGVCGRTHRLAFDAQGCLQFFVSEAHPQVDGETWPDVYGDYRKCPGQCPGGCTPEGCQMSGNSGVVTFNGTATTRPPSHAVELDCSFP